MNQYANDELNHTLDDDELSMLCVLHEQSAIMWDLCEHKVVRNAIAEMYCNMAWENKEFSL